MFRYIIYMKDEGTRNKKLGPLVVVRNNLRLESYSKGYVKQRPPQRLNEGASIIVCVNRVIFEMIFE